MNNEFELDFTDGRFSNVLMDVMSGAKTKDDSEVFSCINLLLDTRRMLALAGDTVVVTGKALAKRVIDYYGTRFLERADAMFERFWTDGNDETLQFKDAVLLKYKAIKVIKIAIMLYEESKQAGAAAKYRNLYKENIERMIAIGGTVMEVENVANDYWESRPDVSLVTLQAGIEWHNTAKLKFDTKRMLQLRSDLSARFSSAMLERAENEKNPRERERLAVCAVKAYTLGNSPDREMFDRLIGYASEEIASRFKELKETIHPDRIDEAEIKGFLNSFWFIHRSLDRPFTDFRDRLIVAATRYYIERTNKAADVNSRINELQNAKNVIGPYLEESNEIDDRLKELRRHRLKNVEPVVYAKRLLEESRSAGKTPNGWRLAAEALNTYPEMGEIDEWKKLIEAKLSIYTNQMDILCDKKRYRWFCTNSITLARDGGCIPLSLKTVSSIKNPIEFTFVDGRADVIDHSSKVGIYREIEPGEEPELNVRGKGFCKCTPEEPIRLKGSGELIFGKVGRIIYNVQSTSLSITFDQPYQLTETTKLTYQTLEQMWANWEMETAYTIILSPDNITIGAGAENGIQVRYMDEAPLTISRKAGRHYTIFTDSFFKAEGVTSNSLPVMEGVVYQAGGVEIKFESRELTT